MEQKKKKKKKRGEDENEKRISDEDGRGLIIIA